MESHARTSYIILGDRISSRHLRGKQVKTIEIDASTDSRLHGSFALACVEVNLCNPLVPRITIGMSKSKGEFLPPEKRKKPF